MQQRKLGEKGPEIGAVGYGAMSFSDMYGPTNEAESHAILDACRDWGVTHLDTANVYGMGKSENAIGSYFKANPERQSHGTPMAIGALIIPPSISRPNLTLPCCGLAWNVWTCFMPIGATRA